MTTDAKAIIKLAERVIWNTGPALGLDDSDIQKIVDGKDPWQMKGLVESAIVAVLESASGDNTALRVKVTKVRDGCQADFEEAVKKKDKLQMTASISAVNCYNYILALIDTTSKAEPRAGAETNWPLWCAKGHRNLKPE